MKLKLLTVVSVLLVILIGVELHFIGKSDAHSAESSENSPAATQPEEEAPIAAEPEAEDPEPDAAAEGPTEPATEAPDETAAEPPEEEPDQSATEGQQEAPANTDPQGTAPSTPQQSQETPPSVPQEAEPAALKIPYSIPGTDLVIKQVNSYDGIFLEDGSDKEVTGISVIVLENQGKTGVEYANITLTQGGKTLEYQASAVPAGTTVVVQEAGAAAYSSADITACTADVA
ncbi:MAG: hypothetical protein IJX71_01665, partial [Oscillospiraceae bacterium]|nr:hypothetical protein [Oscillospiraceae bacterium]